MFLYHITSFSKVGYNIDYQLCIVNSFLAYSIVFQLFTLPTVLEMVTWSAYLAVPTCLACARASSFHLGVLISQICQCLACDKIIVMNDFNSCQLVWMKPNRNTTSGVKI